jgi:hypothetical protein
MDNKALGRVRHLTQVPAVREALVEVGKFDHKIVSQALTEYFAEAEHQSWGGWSPYQAAVLVEFLQDFVRCLKNGLGNYTD